MFNNSSKILFMIILMLGTLITIASNSWLGAWMGLEINLMSFIPLMNDSNNLMTTEASLKYFLTQALTSIVLIFIIIFNMLKTNFNFQFNDYSFCNMIIFSSLMMKSGLAPFHFWFPEVTEGLSWINASILMTWQKLAPFFLMSYLNWNTLIYLPIIFSAFIGSIGGFNQTSLKKIMAFSSINHMSWMLLAMTLNENIWMTYFVFYCLLSISIICLFYFLQMFHINQLLTMPLYSKTLKFCIFFNFLSLGGLPPFLGFYPKWLVINLMMSTQQFFILFFMIMMALITLFFYLRLCYNTFMISTYTHNWKINKSMNNNMINFYMMISIFSSFGLILMPSFFFIF